MTNEGTGTFGFCFGEKKRWSVFGACVDGGRLCLAGDSGVCRCGHCLVLLEVSDAAAIFSSVSQTPPLRSNKSATAAPPPAGKAPGFARIPDNFTTLPQISDALRQRGLESCQLVVGVDFTRSNEEQGRRTFGGKKLHEISIHDRSKKNPYERVIELIGKTLARFDDDNLIPCFGFGDLTTRGTKVFPFDSQPLFGFEKVLDRYREIAGTVILSGPTNFAPVIRAAIEIVKETKEYHVLLIVCDGQVTSENETAAAIVEASHYPLAIVVIGVGDGPWEAMVEFDDQLPERKIDNFQFVDSSKFFSSYDKDPTPEAEAGFAIAALQELPEHYRLCRQHKML